MRHQRRCVAKVSGRAGLFAGALAGLLSTLPPEVVLETAACELPRAVTLEGAVVARKLWAA